MKAEPRAVSSWRARSSAAAEAGWDRVVKHLLDRGADASLRDGSGKLALDYARHPPPAGPGGQVAGGAAAAASREATVALLAALEPKPTAATDPVVNK